jgi:hypothetical protein
MDILTKANLNRVLAELTLMQRLHLKSIVGTRTMQLNESVCEDLVELGLASRSGPDFVPTEHGRYVASLF